MIHSWPLNNTCLNSMGPSICGFFSINMYYSTTRWMVGWILSCGTTDTGGWSESYVDFAAVWRVGAPNLLCCLGVSCILVLGDNRCTLLSVGDAVPKDWKASFRTSKGLWIRRLKRGPFPTSLERGRLAQCPIYKQQCLEWARVNEWHLLSLAELSGSTHL